MNHTCPMCGEVVWSEDDFAAAHEIKCPACGTRIREGRPAEVPVFSADRGWAAERVEIPSIALMVVGGLALVGGIFEIVIAIGILFSEGPQDERIAGAVFYAIAAIYALAVGGFIIYGGLKMKRLESWGLALTAAILAVIPCNVCCVFGMPIGIWALVTLNDRAVKEAFG